MKIKDITLSNFAKYDEVSVSLDDKITYLVGPNGAGKSGLGIRGVQFILQGIAEKSSGGNSPLIGERFRFIGPKAASARGTITLYDEKKGIEIKVERKLTKSGNQLTFEAPEGIELNQQWLTDLFNLFLIAPKKFMELDPKGQARALGIDTDKYDNELAELKSEAAGINRDIKNMGEIQPAEKVEPVDFVQLSREKDDILQFNADLEKRRQHAEQANKAITDMEIGISDIDEEIRQLEESIKAKQMQQALLRERIGKGLEYVKQLPPLEEPMPLDAIEDKIRKANETNQNAMMYQQFLQRWESYQKKLTELESNKQKQEDKKKERLDYIKGCKLPFGNLSIGEKGELLLNGNPIKEAYFSTGELLKVIPILISSRNPELKYVFLQDFSLMDEDNQKQVADYLTGKGFQLVVEVVGKEKVKDKNCILLRDNVVVDDFNEPAKANLL